MRKRLAILAALAVVLAALFAGYVIQRQRHTTANAAGLTFVTDPARIAAAAASPHLLFVNTTFDTFNNRVGFVTLDKPAGERFMTPLRCERVYATPDGGLCLQAHRGALTTYQAIAFDRAFNERGRFPLQGTPSRTRVSRDGRLGASTVFVNGDSYSNASFSTRTTIYDLQHLKPIGDLEQFTVRRGGAVWREPDFNFWGVTFAPERDVFYATLATGGRIFLVRGNAATREMTVAGDDVECPSLSRDGQRIAFKLRKPGVKLGWRVNVLELASGARQPLSEERSVDDQVEWFDEATLLYALPADGGGADIWRAGINGQPALFVRQAISPSVVR